MALFYGFRPSTQLLLHSVAKETENIRSRDNIPFLCQNEDMREPIYLDFSQGCFTLFVSPPGAGKTFAMRGLIGELAASNYNIVDIGSVDNDLYWSQWPLQLKFRQFLPSWRRPQGLPIRAYMPFYLRKRRRLLENMEYGQLDLEDMEYQDITKNLFKQDETDPGVELVSTAWGENKPKNVDELVTRFGNLNAFSSLLQVTGRKFAFNVATINTVGRKLLRLKENGFLGQEHKMDIIEDLKNGFIPVICFQSETQMKAYHSAYISAITRKIVAEKSRKTLTRRLVFIFDDMGAFACPSQGNPSSKDVVKTDLIALGRKKGIYTVGAVQTVSQIPDEILAQVNNFVFFGKLSGDDLDRICKVMSFRPSDMREVLHKYPPRELTDGRRTCVLWSKSGSGISGFSQYGWIPAPCSYHKEQD